MSHSKYYAPSSFMRRRLCPASANVEDLALQQFGDSSSPAAQEGTAPHEIMYQHFVNNKRIKGWVGLTREATEHTEDHDEPSNTEAANARRSPRPRRRTLRSARRRRFGAHDALQRANQP